VRWDTRDLAVLVLAAGVSCAITVLAIGAVIHERAISISEATLLGTVLGAVVGGLVTFLGFRAGNSNGDGPRQPPPPPGGYGR
jgi:hypothetical protein